MGPNVNYREDFLAQRSDRNLFSNVVKQVQIKTDILGLGEAGAHCSVREAYL